jgi:hypothetical protein
MLQKHLHRWSVQRLAFDENPSVVEKQLVCQVFAVEKGLDGILESDAFPTEKRNLNIELIDQITGNANQRSQSAIISPSTLKFASGQVEAMRITPMWYDIEKNRITYSVAQARRDVEAFHLVHSVTLVVLLATA